MACGRSSPGVRRNSSVPGTSWPATPSRSSRPLERRTCSAIGSDRTSFAALGRGTASRPSRASGRRSLPGSRRCKSCWRVSSRSRSTRRQRLAELERKQDRFPVPSAFEYATAPESREIVRLEERYGLFVGGDWVEPRSGEFHPSVSPATEEPLAEVAYAGAADVDLAVAAARDAFENGWSDLPASERAKYLFRIARILQERSREFAVLESLDGGKPIRESRDVDLPLAAAHF